jgi:hypothetical protein
MQFSCWECDVMMQSCCIHCIKGISGHDRACAPCRHRRMACRLLCPSILGVGFPVEQVTGTVKWHGVRFNDGQVWWNKVRNEGGYNPRIEKTLGDQTACVGVSMC